MLTGALLLAGALGGIFALLMLFQATLYASALCLLVVLMQVAAIFYLLGAPLLGFLQVMIYAGAIMVLVVVTVMATPEKLEGLWCGLTMPRPLAFGVLAAAAAEIAVLALSAAGGTPMGELPPWPSLQTELAGILFGRYAVLTEALAVMIFVAALAVVEVWRPQK